MKSFKLEMYDENNKLSIVVYSQAEGKEQAIAKELDKLFLRDWRAHGRIEKVIATQH